jgi:tetratricopeptide (TPR) repeat protein
VVKKQTHFQTRLSSADLADRVRKALTESRTQQALELAKQLQKQEPTAVHLALLKEAYLQRAQHLRSQGYERDAGTTLLAGVPYAGDDSLWLAKVAEELAACGHGKQAMELLPPTSRIRERVVAKAADQAVGQREAGRNLMPEELRGQFDRVLQAFKHLESGQDEQAREALQEIGLQSPFLEWKLMLRGLAAYYQKDDARAVENWSRLSNDRLPARLVAPLRFSIDSAYRTAQEPKAQAFLQKQADRLQDVGPIHVLRDIRSALATGKGLAQAFRLIEGVLPALKELGPHLVPRLAYCFYWAIIQKGTPEDMTRYRRVFGDPVDDPGLVRVRALAAEHFADLTPAHALWQQYEQTVTANPAAWPGEQATRVRALIWAHMGKNAAFIPDDRQMAKLPQFLRDHPDRPRALNPNADTCFRRSIELAPDQLEPYEALFHYYQDRKKAKKAEQAARRLLKQFPDHVPTLEALADLRTEQHDYPEALTLLQRALKLNPLHGLLRLKLRNAHLFNARAHTEAGRFEEARAAYRTSLAIDNRHEGQVLCRWAACEFKAGEPARAEELLQQASAKTSSHMDIALNMLIEVIRLKLARQLKARFDQEFKESLAEPPSAEGAAAATLTMASYRISGVSYVGQKTHEKKVLAYLAKARPTANFGEEQLRNICAALLALNAHGPLRTFAQVGRRRFPTNPHFPWLEAESYIAQSKGRMLTWRVQPLLNEAERLAQQSAQDPGTKELLKQIQERQEMMRALNPFGRMFDEAFGDFGDGDDWDEEDGDDYEDDWSFDPFGRSQSRSRRRRR